MRVKNESKDIDKILQEHMFLDQFPESMAKIIVFAVLAIFQNCATIEYFRRWKLKKSMDCSFVFDKQHAVCQVMQPVQPMVYNRSI